AAIPAATGAPTPVAEAITAPDIRISPTFDTTAVQFSPQLCPISKAENTISAPANHGATLPAIHVECSNGFVIFDQKVFQPAACAKFFPCTSHFISDHIFDPDLKYFAISFALSHPCQISTANLVKSPNILSAATAPLNPRTTFNKYCCMLNLLKSASASANSFTAFPKTSFVTNLYILYSVEFSGLSSLLLL